MAFKNRPFISRLDVRFSSSGFSTRIRERQEFRHFPMDLKIINGELKQNMLNICETGNILHLDYALI